MAIALVAGQTASNLAAASTTVVVTLPNNPTAGNFVVVGAAMNSSVSTMTCADSNGNNYTATSSSPASASGGRAYIFYLANAPSNASKTITITSSNPNNLDGWAAEFSGVATSTPVDQQATHISAGTSTNINDPTVTPTQDGELVIGVAFAGGTISTADSPFTGIGVVRDGNYAEYYIQPAKAARAIAFTQSPSSAWVAIEASFKAAASSSKPLMKPLFWPRRLALLRSVKPAPAPIPAPALLQADSRQTSRLIWPLQLKLFGKVLIGPVVQQNPVAPRKGVPVLPWLKFSKTTPTVIHPLAPATIPPAAPDADSRQARRLIWPLLGKLAPLNRPVPKAIPPVLPWLKFSKTTPTVIHPPVAATVPVAGGGSVNGTFGVTLDPFTQVANGQLVPFDTGRAKGLIWPLFARLFFPKPPVARTAVPALPWAKLAKGKPAVVRPAVLSGPPVGIGGTLAQTIDAFTLVANGQVVISGSLAATLANVTLSATGQVVITGTFGQTIAAFTQSATGTVIIQGTFGQTVGAVTQAATGAVIIQGTFGQTIDPVTLAANGGAPSSAVNGTFGQTVDAFTLSANGSLEPTQAGGKIRATSGAANATSFTRKRYRKLIDELEREREAKEPPKPAKRAPKLPKSVQGIVAALDRAEQIFETDPAKFRQIYAQDAAFQRLWGTLIAFEGLQEEAAARAEEAAQAARVAEQERLEFEQDEEDVMMLLLAA